MILLSVVISALAVIKRCVKNKNKSDNSDAQSRFWGAQDV